MGKTIPKRSDGGADQQQVLLVRPRDPATLSAQERQRRQRAAAMLHRWEEEEAQMTVAEAEEAVSAWEDFEHSMNENRRGYRLLYPQQNHA